MSAFLSDSWYRVAGLRPRLHAHVRISRQRFRGRAWYVLRDASNGQAHRFTVETYQLIRDMDGSRSVEELWRGLLDRAGDGAPSQDEVIDLLHRLHAADLLCAGVPADPAEVIQRSRRKSRLHWLRQLANPIALRVPLWDPDRFLTRSAAFGRLLMTPAAALVWAITVGIAVTLAAEHWDELTDNVADRVLGLQSLVLLGLIYPVVKLCHELGHAYAVKCGGGEVHELGLMFLVFAPVPYVDASASTVFHSKWQRIGVAAAGILVDLFLAALAMFVWLAAEPGITRSVAYNVMLAGGVSTLLFNGNPLIRCDAYYILSDVLEIPNLSQRSADYLLARLKSLCGGRDARGLIPGRGESFWLALYAPASWLYRLSLMLAVAWFVAGRYFFAGAILALCSVWSILAWPLLRQILSATVAARAPRRNRALHLVYGAIAAALLGVTVVAVPCWTNAEGVVWVPENAEVRAGTAGFVTRLLAAPGRSVIAGEPLLELEDADLAADRRVRGAKVSQLQVQLATEMFDDRLKAELTRQSLAAEKAGVERTERRVEGLLCAAGRAGLWVVPNAGDLPGRYFAQGALVGYVLSGSLRTVRVVVSQEEADLVRAHTRRVELRLADRPGQTLHATAVREVPGGSERLPTKALALAGGGSYATDPRDSSELKTLARTFQFDLELEEQVTDLTFGTRAYVRFEHPWSPLAAQVWRHVRQLFLSRLTV